MTNLEHTKALAEKAQLGHLVAVTSGVRNGDHWYICDDNESVAMISANDGIDEELRQPRAELFAYAVNNLPALVAAVERVQAIATEWAAQPTDYDEDTEQQIEDGKQILAILEALEIK